MKIKTFSEEHRKKLSIVHKGLVSGNKGKFKSFTYNANHHWSQDNLARKSACEWCNKTNCKLELANLDHNYRRVVEDWVTLCVSCHRNYDIKHHNYRGWG